MFHLIHRPGAALDDRLGPGLNRLARLSPVLLGRIPLPLLSEFESHEVGKPRVRVVRPFFFGRLALESQQYGVAEFVARQAAQPVKMKGTELASSDGELDGLLRIGRQDPVVIELQRREDRNFQRNALLVFDHLMSLDGSGRIGQ